MSQAIKAILREHGSMGAVLHGLRFLVQEIRTGRTGPDFALLHAMIHYIDAFPERLHHPKEDRYLFPRVRQRTHEADAALERLEKQHERGAVLTRELRDAVARYEEQGPAAFAVFAERVEQYTTFYWQHMRDEEELVLPVALRALTPADWEEIDAAFAANPDPLSQHGGPDDLPALFRRITLLAPPPIGLGSGSTA